jgi:hypothetical protein
LLDVDKADEGDCYVPQRLIAKNCLVWRRRACVFIDPPNLCILTSAVQ